jgi:hypothetical protein
VEQFLALLSVFQLVNSARMDVLQPPISVARSYCDRGKGFTSRH